MDLIRLIIRAYLLIPYHFHKLTGTGAFGIRAAEYIPGPIASDGNPLKKALLQHHVKQFHASSCSVASVAACVNALLAEKTDGRAPITQKDLLETVKSANWKERMGRNGHKGKRGLPLALLGEVVKSSLDAYGLAYEAVETVQMPANSQIAGEIRKILWQRLHDFETAGSGLVIAHFDQGQYIPALNIPHISPVGGFDASNGRVTILDVDRDQAMPYHISFDTFCRGLSSNYHHVFKPFGYGRGGYVYIRRQGSKGV
jgi:hypothetical protein